MENEKVLYCNACLSDISGLVSLEQKVWGENMGAGSEIWRKRIERFSEGVFIAKENNVIIGVVAIHLLKWDYPSNYYPTWFEVSGNAQFDNFDPEGDTFFGDDLSVLPDRAGVAERLIEFGIAMRKKRNIRQGFLGSRIPSLRAYILKHKIKEEDVNEDFVLKRAKKDWEVRFFMQKGFKIVAVRKDYFPLDEESLGWGVIVKSP